MTLKTNKPKRTPVFWLKLALIVTVFVFVLVIAANKIKGLIIGNVIANLPEPINPVTAVVVEGKEWTPVINTTGLVRPNQGAMLSAEAAGTIKKINVQSGQSVKKGDLLVELDSEVELASLRATEAQFSAAQATYDRYSKLVKSQSVSRTEFDSAKSTYEQLEANINSQKAALQRRKIVAPFDGVTGIVKVNEGEYIASGTEVVRVEDHSSMKVDFSVAQNNLEDLHIGQKVTATADARLGETFAAVITAIEPAVNKSTGLIDVQATFDSEDGKKLLSGMFTRLRVALPTEREQIVLPQVSITYNMYGELAYVLKPLSEEDKAKYGGNENFNKMYRAQQITVFTKDRQGIYAQLQGDEVKVGDIVVTGGQQRLSNGSLVVVSDKAGVGTIQPASKTKL